MAVNGENPVLTFQNKLRIREYAEGYRLYDLIRGASKGREWKASVFFFLGIAMLFMLMMNDFNIPKLPVCTIVLLICMYMCTHYIYMLPKKAKLKGEHIFKSSKLLSKEYTFQFNKDYFIMENEFEKLKRYYTEITDCIETDELFLLIGGIEKQIIVISKRSLKEEESQILSHHFKREMIRQYRRTKSKHKGRKV